MTAEREAFYARIDGHHLAPLWTRLKSLVPQEPTPVGVPYRWRYETLRPYVLESATHISAKEAERRVLILENPALRGSSQITNTLYAGLQLIMPGEVAPAHRHTQSALRFIVEGSGAYTAVEGEKTIMQPGDFVITPSWTWHHHGHEASGPMVWLDGLDIPLVMYFNSTFREDHELDEAALKRPAGDALARYGSGLLPVDHERKSLNSPVFNYPYARTRDALHALGRAGAPDAHLGHLMRYVNPLDGGWAMPTMATMIRLLPKGLCDVAVPLERQHGVRGGRRQRPRRRGRPALRLLGRATSSPYRGGCPTPCTRATRRCCSRTRTAWRRKSSASSASNAARAARRWRAHDRPTGRRIPDPPRYLREIHLRITCYPLVANATVTVDWVCILTGLWRTDSSTLAVAPLLSCTGHHHGDRPTHSRDGLVRSRTQRDRALAHLRKIASDSVRHRGSHLGAQQPAAGRAHRGRTERRERRANGDVGGDAAWRRTRASSRLRRLRCPDAWGRSGNLARLAIGPSDHRVAVVDVRDVLPARTAASLVDAGGLCTVDVQRLVL